jgi:hypothetical protein
VFFDLFFLKPGARKAQTSVEYLVLLGGILALLIIVYVLLRANVFAPSETKIVNQGGEIQQNISSVKCGATPVATCPGGVEFECDNFKWVCPTETPGDGGNPGNPFTPP